LITIDEYEFIAHGRNLLTGKCKNLFYQICAGEVGQTPSVIAEYEVKISDRNGFLQASLGVCDVDLATVGIQSGIPLIQYGDSAEVTIDTNNAIVGLGNF